MIIIIIIIIIVIVIIIIIIMMIVTAYLLSIPPIDLGILDHSLGILDDHVQLLPAETLSKVLRT
jgi:hypothetical protein